MATIRINAYEGGLSGDTSKHTRVMTWVRDETPPLPGELVHAPNGRLYKVIEREWFFDSTAQGFSEVICVLKCFEVEGKYP